MPLTRFMCISCVSVNSKSVVSVMTICIFLCIHQAEQPVCPFFFNAFRLSRCISLKWIQGHLKGHGGKNWAYIFNANPADGTLNSPNWDHLVAWWPGLTCYRSIFSDLIIMMISQSSYGRWLVIQKVNVLH